MEKQRPVHTNRREGVQMAVFERTDDEGRVWFSTTIKTSYKKDDEWHNSFNYTERQLRAVEELALEAQTFVDARKRALATEAVAVN